MARPTVMTRGNRSSVSDLDISWQKWTRCRLCNRRFCINNYADQKVRLNKVRGVILCPWCKGKDKGDFTSALYSLVDQLALKECTEMARQDLGYSEEPCGKCAPCIAKKVMMKSPEAKAVKRRKKRLKEKRNGSSNSK